MLTLKKGKEEECKEITMENSGLIIGQEWGKKECKYLGILQAKEMPETNKRKKKQRNTSYK